MDYQTHPGKSNSFETAAMVLSIIAICTFFNGFISIICGSLGIVFGLLSKNGNMHCSKTAKASILIGTIACIAATICIVISFILIIQEFGGIDGLIEQYESLYQSIENGSSYYDIYNGLYDGSSNDFSGNLYDGLRI